MLYKKNMKFIHTSDWHIDNSFSNFSNEKKEKLNNSRWQCIERLFEHCKKYTIPLILVGGDQFDNGFTTSKDNLIRLLKLIDNYKDIQVIMIAGNHDPYNDRSIYKKVEESLFPKNLKFVKDKYTIHLKELNCKIFAASLNSENGNFNPLNWIDDNNEDCIRIGLAHGSIMIEGKYSPDYFPIEKDFSINKKLDYFALGHYHTFSQCNNRTYYCGTIEQMQSNDTFYALEIEIEKGREPIVKKIDSLNNYRWYKIKKSLNNNFESIIDELKEYRENDILEIELDGYLNFENYNKFKDNIKLLKVFECFLEDKIKIEPSDKEIESLQIQGYLKDILDTLKNGVLDSYIKELKDIDINEEELKKSMLLKIYDFFKDKG